MRDSRRGAMGEHVDELSTRVRAEVEPVLARATEAATPLVERAVQTAAPLVERTAQAAAPLVGRAVQTTAPLVERTAQAAAPLLERAADTAALATVHDVLETSRARGGAALLALRGAEVVPARATRRWPWAVAAAVVGAAAGAAVALLVGRLLGTDAPDAQEPEDVEAVVDRGETAPPVV